MQNKPKNKPMANEPCICWTLDAKILGIQSNWWACDHVISSMCCLLSDLCAFIYTLLYLPPDEPQLMLTAGPGMMPSGPMPSGPMPGGPMPGNQPGYAPQMGYPGQPGYGQMPPQGGMPGYGMWE